MTSRDESITTSITTNTNSSLTTQGVMSIDIDTSDNANDQNYDYLLTVIVLISVLCCICICGLCAIIIGLLRFIKNGKDKHFDGNNNTSTSNSIRKSNVWIENGTLDGSTNIKQVTQKPIDNYYNNSLIKQLKGNIATQQINLANLQNLNQPIPKPPAPTNGVNVDHSLSVSKEDGIEIVCNNDDATIEGR